MPLEAPVYTPTLLCTTSPSPCVLHRIPPSHRVLPKCAISKYVHIRPPSSSSLHTLASPSPRRLYFGLWLRRWGQRLDLEEDVQIEASIIGAVRYSSIPKSSPLNSRGLAFASCSSRDIGTHVWLWTSSLRLISSNSLDEDSGNSQLERGASFML